MANQVVTLIVVPIAVGLVVELISILFVRWFDERDDS